jgi:predicted RNA binding protein YcfA (HicA-like mRNA interferase family)
MPSVPIEHREFLRKLRRLGFSGPVQVGRYPFMIRGRQKLAIPNPHGKTIDDVKLLKRILRQAGINDQEWDAA